MIEMKNIEKTFNPGGISEVRALRGVDFHAREGEFVTIIGTNGSGKSTLLNIISGSILPDSGSIKIAGRDVTQKQDYQRADMVARVFQNPFMGTAPKMTIAENLHIANLRGKAKLPMIKLISSKIDYYREKIKILEMNLDDRLDNLIGTLSGGQRQALTLLMAVLRRPDVLLLDEHTAALDPKSAAQVIALTRRFIKKEKLTAVMVTHSMQQALDLGSRTIMMNRGEIIDDLSENEKRRMTTDDLLDKFADLRKREKLTDSMLEELRREYF
jgi:putative ABC transport system ATP-binding protein